MPVLTPSEVVGLIEGVFPGVKTDAPGKPWSLALHPASEIPLGAVVEAVDLLAPELITLTGESLVQFVSAVALARSAVTTWQNSSPTMATVALNAYEAHGPGNAVSAIRRLLKLCPDSVPAPSTHELAFVADGRLRDSLRQDLSWCNTALTNREWKSCTVIAGSTSEALLLWAIQRVPNAIAGALSAAKKAGQADSRCAVSDVDRWHLGDYTGVALQLDMIRFETAKQVWLSRDFRNLIHAGAVQRVGQECSRATALAALAGVEMVAGDLAHPPSGLPAANKATCRPN